MSGKDKIEYFSESIDHRRLSDRVHAVESEEGDDGEIIRSDLSMLVEKISTDILRDILGGDKPIHMRDIRAQSVSMKAGRAKKLSNHIRELAESEFVKITDHNRPFIGMLIWQGPYDQERCGYMACKFS